MSRSSGTSRMSCSSLESEDFSDMSLFILEDDPFLPPTPPPTSDEEDSSTSDLAGSSVDDDFARMTISPLWERPETSTSSIFSFVVDREATPLPAAALSLPTFIAPENIWFFDSEAASIIAPIDKFHQWSEESKPQFGSFELEFAEEQAKNPRLVRSAPVIPSLFKKREYECGYCRSVGHFGWKTHTRQKCAQLRALPPCKLCGATGEMNHTETYCPDKPLVSLQLKKSYLAGLDRSRAARRQHFKKYTRLIEQIFPRRDNIF